MNKVRLIYFIINFIFFNNINCEPKKIAIKLTRNNEFNSEDDWKEEILACLIILMILHNIDLLESKEELTIIYKK